MSNVWSILNNFISASFFVLPFLYGKCFLFSIIFLRRIFLCLPLYINVGKVLSFFSLKLSLYECIMGGAAVMYGIGARFDEDPNLFFLLRGVDPKELIASSACIDNIVGSADSEIEEENLSDIFGIDLDDAANEKQADKAEKGSAKKTHKAGSKSVDTPANKCGKSSLSLADYIASDIDVPTKKQNKLKKMQIADRYNDEDILPDITKKKRMGKKAYGTWTGADVKRLRESKGMTKIMFAKKLNITTYRLNKLESSSEPV